MNDVMNDMHIKLMELEEKCAVLQLDNIRLHEQCDALRSRLPFTSGYKVIKHELKQPVMLRGKRITHVTYTLPTE